MPVIQKVVLSNGTWGRPSIVEEHVDSDSDDYIYNHNKEHTREQRAKPWINNSPVDCGKWTDYAAIGWKRLKSPSRPGQMRYMAPSGERHTTLPPLDTSCALRLPRFFCKDEDATELAEDALRLTVSGKKVFQALLVKLRAGGDMLNKSDANKMLVHISKAAKKLHKDAQAAGGNTKKLCAAAESVSGIVAAMTYESWWAMCNQLGEVDAAMSELGAAAVVALEGLVAAGALDQVQAHQLARCLDKLDTECADYHGLCKAASKVAQIVAQEAAHLASPPQPAAHPTASGKRAALPKTSLK